MILTPEDIEVVERLDHRIRAASQDLYHTAALATYPDPLLGHVFGDESYTVVDILQAAILTQTPILLAGDTGTGKTDMLRMASTAAFGCVPRLPAADPR